MTTTIKPDGFELTDKDRKVLSVVHPTLARIVTRAAEITEIPFMVFEGVRTKTRQRMLVKKGASKTMNSRHLTGHATDLVPLINGKPVWDVPATVVIAGAMFQAADELGYKGKMRWGGDWDRDGDHLDERFYDGPHFELERKYYSKPAARTQAYLDGKGTGTPPNQTSTKVSKFSGKHRTAFAESVQRAANEVLLSLADKPIKVDGYYGDDTRLTVARLQRLWMLDTVDGLWGPDTSEAYHQWRAREAERKSQEKFAAESKAQSFAAPVENPALDSGVVSDDKSTRPVTDRMGTLDREAQREEVRGATPTPPEFTKSVDDAPEPAPLGNGFVLVLLLVVVAGAFAAAAYYG